MHADDSHRECVSCLGKSHAESTLTETDCSHCDNMSLASLRSRIAFFSESDSVPRALPFSSSQEPVRRKQRGREIQCSNVSELTSAQVPRASLSPHRETSPSSSPSLTSVPLPARAIWSSLVGVTTSCWMTTCHWQPRTPRSCWAWLPGMDAKLLCVLSKAVKELGLEWSPPEEPSGRRLDEWFLLGHRQAPCQRSSPFFPEVHDKLTRSWRAPYAARFCTFASSALTSVDGAEDKGYEKLPPLDKSVAAHLCPSSALAGRAYSSAGQAASALHSMAVLQVFQAKLLTSTDESGPDPATLRELRSVTDLALCATKATAQAIGRSMASLVVVERHLWLTLTEIKDADKVPFLDAPISPNGLFGPAVEGFAEHFTEAQKLSQAMRHFLPKRSSSAAASGLPKSAPTKQPPKPAPAAAAATQPSLSLDDVAARPDATRFRSARYPGPR